MTSSDIEEVLGMADIIVTMYRGRQVATYRRGERHDGSASSPTSPIRSRPPTCDRN